MEFTAEMIAGLLQGEVVGDKNAKVHTVGSIEEGKEGALAYLMNPKYEQYIYTTKASIVLVGKDFEPKEPVSATLIRVADVGACILQLLAAYDAARPQKTGISKMCSISEKAQMGENCYVGDFAVVEAGAKIGNADNKRKTQCRHDKTEDLLFGHFLMKQQGTYQGYDHRCKIIA